MKKLLKKSERFTGLICDGNLYAGASHALKEKNKKVPQDVSVVCVGGAPEVTSVAYDNREIGRAGVARLIDKLTNPGWKPERVIIPNSLIICDSTRKLV